MGTSGPRYNGTERMWMKLAPVIVLAAVLGGCHDNPAASNIAASPQFTYRPPFDWPLSNPRSQGMDTLRVAAGLSQVKVNPFMSSFLVVRNDSLVIEYYNGLQKENDFDIHSASKSFISALVGIAIDRGFLGSTQDRILSYFPGLDTAGIDSRKQGWTVEQFLTMRSGIDWVETDDHTSLFTDNVDWLNTALELPLKYSPGERFVYTSPNVNVLSAIIARAAGMSTYEFAERYLFTPLNISVRDWARDPQDVFLGGTGMRFRPRDLARFGQLYLHNGLLDGKQIVPRDWIQESLVPRNQQESTWGAFSAVNYGYLWWNNYDAQDSVFMAAGYAGQFIFVVPAQNMVIVTIGYDDVTTAQADAHETTIIEIVKQYFL
jgi:CubicO group peptidase (beta-lactamase class C family)